MASTGLWAVIVGFNGLEDTLQCLASVQGAPARPHVVYVDNASASDAAGAVEAAFPWCHVVRNATNEGYAGGNNRGIEYALAHGADRVLVLNNDTIVAPQLFSTVIAASEANPEFGVLGPVIGFIGEPSVVMTDGCVFNDTDRNEFFSRQEVPLDGRGGCSVHETDIVNGCCIMLRADVLRTIGLFDERFFLVHEESDLCMRARRAGFNVGVIDRMLIWHKGSTSFKRTGRRLQKYFDVRNLALLLRKHDPFAGTRRSAARSWFSYWRYAYHRFCLEHEARETGAARAVLEGLEDAVFRRTGPYLSRRRYLVPPLKGAFLCARAVMTLAPRPLPVDLLRRRP
jgi:GT2 family glycosyltransferase